MTREEAITVLKGLLDNTLFSNQHKAAFNIAIHDIKAHHDWDINNLILINKDNYEPLEQEPRWIPVSEDAPPKGTRCLWCNKQGRVFTSEITYRSECSSYVGKHGYFSNGLENHGDIVAWMPLPKASREVKA